jgi:hypothetical protein
MRRSIIALTVAGMLATSASAWAADDPRETRSERMAVDLLVARPVGIAATLVGGAAFLVTLPFSAIGGNVAEAADALFLGPAREAFVRCLGCSSVNVRSISGDR